MGGLTTLITSIFYYKLTMQKELSHWDAWYNDRHLLIGHASFQSRQSSLSRKIPAKDFGPQDLDEQIFGTRDMPSLMRSEPQSHSDHLW